MDVEPITPLPISVATKTGTISLDSCCTKKGLLPLTLDDGSVYYQPCYYCKNATETIISPDAILQASDILVHWTQEGHKDGGPGNIRFSSDSGLYAITLTLENKMDCTTVPPTSSRLLKILLVLVYPPSTASRPLLFRPLPPKNVARGTTRSTAIA